MSNILSFKVNILSNSFNLLLIPQFLSPNFLWKASFFSSISRLEKFSLLCPLLQPNPQCHNMQAYFCVQELLSLMWVEASLGPHWSPELCSVSWLPGPTVRYWGGGGVTVCGVTSTIPNIRHQSFLDSQVLCFIADICLYSYSLMYSGFSFKMIVLLYERSFIIRPAAIFNIEKIPDTIQTYF